MDPGRRAALTEAMRRLADGDRSAGPEVARAVAPPVAALAQRMLGDRADAEDVAQDVLVDLFRRAPDFDRDGDALAWAMTLAVWHCRTARRRRDRSKVVPIESAPEPPAIEPSAEELLDDRRMRTHLEQAIGALGERDREALDEILAGGSLDAALRKRKERMIVKLRRLLFGEVP